MKNILVIGRERSGTKFLTNLLQLNFDLAAVQSDYHDGIIESNLVFNYSGIFGDTPKGENKRAMQLLFKQEYFYKFTNISNEQFDSIQFKQPIQLLWKVLDFHAMNSGKSGWVQKVPARFPWYYDDVKAHKIIIQRNIMHSTSSFMKLRKNNSSWFIIKCLFSANFYKKVEDQYSKNHQILIVKYEDLRDATFKTLLRISELFNLSKPSEFKITKYNNSSYKRLVKLINNRRLVFLNKIVRIIFFFVPGHLCLNISKIYWARKKSSRFVPRSFPAKC